MGDRPGKPAPRDNTRDMSRQQAAGAAGDTKDTRDTRGTRDNRGTRDTRDKSNARDNIRDMSAVLCR